ncbi:MAG: hypothetical protein AAGF29_00215 [Pseudomonadota bacterium]
MSKWLRTTLAAFFALIAFTIGNGARAEPVTFVALATIKPDGQTGYDEFIEKVTPIWNANGMRVLARLKVVDLMIDPAFPLPTEIAVIHADTREGFNAYIASDAYAKIKDLRLNAVKHLTVLEGNLFDRSGEKFLANNPMAVVTMAGRRAVAPRSGMTVDVMLYGPVKGERSPFLEAVQRVHILPLGFDDNPTNFANTADQAFIAEQIR